MGAPGGETRDDPVVGADEVLDLEPEVGASTEHERVGVRDRLRVVPAEAAVVDGVGRAEAREGAAVAVVPALDRRGDGREVGLHAPSPPEQHARCTLAPARTEIFSRLAPRAGSRDFHRRSPHVLKRHRKRCL